MKRKNRCARNMAELSTHRKWGQFRLTVVGGLLSSPPLPGELGKAIEALASQTWKHPISEEEVEFGFSTIEAWYYQAKNERGDRTVALNRKVRRDKGERKAIDDKVGKILQEQYAAYPWWTVQLHAKNLQSRLKMEGVGLAPSYSTVLRYMRSHGLKKLTKPKVNERGELEDLPAAQMREIACFEAEYVNQIWSLDFHDGKLRVLTKDGQWLQPKAMAILDHHSRLCCHISWGLFENTTELVKGYSVAVMKRGRPATTLSDNGAAMRSGEFRQGLQTLGVRARKIKPRTPHQNGKTENLWSSLEEEFVNMVIGQKDLTLERLNKLSQAWIEMHYNRRIHRETGKRPIDLFIEGKNVGLPPVSEDELRRSFRIEIKRRPRSSDKSIRIEGVSFRLPQRYHHLSEVTIRYARWDLGFVHLVDSASGQELEQIFPVDKVANATSARREIEQPIAFSQDKNRHELPPFLEETLRSYEGLTQSPAEAKQKETNHAH